MRYAALAAALVLFAFQPANAGRTSKAPSDASDRCPRTLTADQYKAAGGQSGEKPATEKQPPKYPADLVEQEVEGRVVLEVTIGPDGKVLNARVLRSDHDSFSRSAVEAVLGWTYAAPKVDGNPVCLVASVNVDFKLRPAEGESTLQDCEAIVSEQELAQRGGSQSLISAVNPQYPRSRISSGWQGAVKVLIVVSDEGRVVDAEVKDPEHKDFKSPALRAAREWRYSPATIDGKPVCVAREIKVNFRLR